MQGNLTKVYQTPQNTNRGYSAIYSRVAKWPYIALFETDFTEILQTWASEWRRKKTECGCWWTEYFRNCWDFPAQPSLELTENGWNKRKCPVSSSSLGEKCLVNTTGRRRIAKLLQHASLRDHNDGAFQQINKPCHDVQIKLFSWHQNEFSALKWPPQSPHVNTKEHLWHVVKLENCIMYHLTNLHQARDAAWCLHFNVDQNLIGIFPAPSWIYAVKNKGSSEGKSGSNPELARCN